MILGYGLGALFLFPYGNIGEWMHMEEKAKSFEMQMPFIEEARESLGLVICFLVNLVFMLIGFKKAKLPNYNFGYFFTSEETQRKKAN